MDLRYELTLRYSIRDAKRQLRILVREFNGPMFVTGRSRTDDGGYGLSFHLDLPGQLRSVAQLPGFVKADLRLRVFGHDELSGVGKAFTAVFESDSRRHAAVTGRPLRKCTKIPDASGFGFRYSDKRILSGR